MEDPERLGQAMRTRGLLQTFRGEQAAARESFKEALVYLQRANNNSALTAYLALVVGVSYNEEGCWSEAAPHLSEAVRAMESQGLTTEYFEGSITLPYVTGCIQLGYNQAVQGRVDPAARLFEQADAAAEAGEANLLTRIAACVWHARFATLTRQPTEALWERTADLLARAEAASAPLLEAMAHYAVAVLCRARGQHADAHRHALASVNLATSGEGTQSKFIGHAYYELGLALLALQRLKESREACETGLRPARNQAKAWLEPRYAYLRARLALARKGLTQTVRNRMERSIAGDEAAGATLPAAHTRLEFARLLADHGRQEEAEELMAALQERSPDVELPAWLGGEPRPSPRGNAD